MCLTYASILAGSPRFCISNKLPFHADLSGSGPASSGKGSEHRLWSQPDLGINSDSQARVNSVT